MAEAGRAGGRGEAGGLRIRGVAASSPLEQRAPPLVAVELLRRDQLLAELARQPQLRLTAAGSLVAINSLVIRIAIALEH